METTQTRLQKDRAKRKVRKHKKQEAKALQIVKKEQQELESELKTEPEFEVEYVVVNPFETEDNANEEYEELKEIFTHFLKVEEDEKKEEMPEQGVTNGKADAPVKEEKLSKKKRKLQRRLPIAVLKAMVDRPDLVEPHDTCAANPYVLMHLKAYRNTVPVPRHWSQKRKYLQGKRGQEKGGYELPDFIKKTGIMDIRNATLEKDAGKALKAKARERLNPSMGKIDIDYQVLHDAFFKWQTKPRFSTFGDVYYESKEFEVEMTEKRPGVISDKLKEALGMMEGAPTPWLHNMQRVGLPPSYPGLKIPGFNAALPPGANYGYHPGGWGKPPTDEMGRPIFQESLMNQAPEESTKLHEYIHWGSLPAEESSSEEEVPEESSASEAEEANKNEEEYDPMGDDNGMDTPLSGLETPTNIEGQLRKRKKDLYEVLEEQESHISSKDIYGSSHKYVIDKKQLRGGDQVELSIDPSEISTLTEDALKKRAADKFNAEKNKNNDDDDNEDENEKKRKRQSSGPDKGKKKKKNNDFKF
jgi:splicing factor 3B subunit 2